MRPGERPAHPASAVLGVLLALFGALATVTGTAPQAIAGVGGPPEADVRHVVAAGPNGGERATETSDQRLLCQLQEGSAEYRESGDHRTPEKRDHATVRKAGADQLEWIQPGHHELRAPQAPAAEIAGPADAAVQHRSHKTFDSRAPPMS